MDKPKHSPSTRAGGKRARARRWRGALAIAALAIGAAATAGCSLTGASGNSPANPTSSAGPAGLTGQAALLNATLSAANSPGGVAASLPAQAVSGAPAPTAAGAGAGLAVRRCARALRAARAARIAGRPRVRRGAVGAAAARCRLIRRRVVRFFLLNGVEGQFSFRTPDGIRALAYERGVIESVAAGSSFEVRASDGTTWTWELLGDTVVRDLSGRLTAAALRAGEPVWVGGPVVSGAQDARLIFVHPPSASEVTSAVNPAGS